MSRPGIRPSLAWYWVAGGLLLATIGSVAFGVAGIAALDWRVRNFQRTTVPGQAVITLFKPGLYVLYAEGPDAAGPRPLPGFTASLAPANGGDPVPVDLSRTGPSYDLGDRSGRAVGSFVVTEPGAYLLDVGGPSQPGITGLAVGGDLRRGLGVPIALIIVPMLTLAPAALVTVIVTAVRRHGSRRRTRPATPWLTVTPAPPPVPPGWHLDPAGHHEYRFWDGQRWTDQVWDHGTPGTDPPA